MQTIYEANLWTNGHYRPLLSGYELPESERSNFDYMDNIDDGTFFQYKGDYYDLGEFIKLGQYGLYDKAFHELGYHASKSTSYFDGLLIGLSDCNDFVKVAYYAS